MADAVSIVPTHLSIDIPNIHCMDVAKKVYHIITNIDDGRALIAGHLVQHEFTQLCPFNASLSPDSSYVCFNTVHRRAFYSFQLFRLWSFFLSFCLCCLCISRIHAIVWVWVYDKYFQFNEWMSQRATRSIFCSTIVPEICIAEWLR